MKSVFLKAVLSFLQRTKWSARPLRIMTARKSAPGLSDISFNFIDQPSTRGQFQVLNYNSKLLYG